MKDQRKTEIKVGITVLVALAIFLWILSWAKNFSLTSEEKTLQVKFDNVSGLEVGDYVTVNGVRKGFVEDFNVEGEDVIVRISLNEDINLKKDAAFSITMLDLMGGKKIDINPGTSGEVLNYDVVHSGTFSADIPAVMSMVGNAQEDINSAIKDMRITLTALNDYLNDKQLNNDLKTSASNLSQVSVKLNNMLDENRQSLKTLLDNSAELTKEAKEFISSNKQSLENSVNDLQSILKKTDSLLVKTNRFADELTSKKNNLGKILYDEELFNNLSQTLKQVKELTSILIQQLNNEGINVDANVDLF